ncbi:MAG: gliding motility-associated-like protein [Bacteroidia bacterium]|jgi:gliding motility-associated-like protein
MLSGVKSFATHIMGGDLTYRYISEDSFEFTLAFYVDCINGNPGAIASDKFAIIGFFNAKNKDFIDKVEIERNAPVRVSKLNYACVTPPTNACVDRYEYVFRKRVKVGNDGIIVSFQRCCRNHTITNLVDPGGTGMTLLAKIPPKSTVSVNSNPVFKDSPPNFLCNDAPLIFDHSATDSDGDSLYYDLYLPFKGADANVPRPVQPSNPDYDEVSYTAAYGLNNLMGGTEKLKINGATGLLTALPNKIGQFVVGIRVSEYRNGVKIGETLRDYQFNVLQCDIKISANFDLPDIKCFDSVVTLNNTSQFGDSYQWEIFDQSKVIHNSINKHTSVTLKNKGVYRIKLVTKNAQCADSIEKNIVIGGTLKIKANFDLVIQDSCGGGLITINNKSDKTPDWYWDLGLGAGEQHNAVINQFNVDQPGTYRVKLRISDTVNCAHDDSVEVSFNIRGRDTLYAAFDYAFPNDCNPGKLVLTKTDAIEDDWFWDIEGDIEDYTNEPTITLDELNAGLLNVKLRHGKLNNPCQIALPIEKEIEIDSLEVSSAGLSLYNVFTPNGDQLNNCFQLDMTESECYEVKIKIYNRWGELVYQSDDALRECWDGKRKNGDFYPAGTYFGVVSVKHLEVDKGENISMSITFIR